MKKLVMGMMVTAFASVAFGDVTPAIVSENFFGSIEVKSKSEFTLVATPFEGFASQFKDSEYGTPTSNNILVRDVVAVEKLYPNDTLSIHNPQATDEKEEFHNYIARKAKVKVPGVGTFEYMEWLASMWFEEDSMTSHKFPDPELRLVPVGSGMFVGKDPSNMTADKLNEDGTFSIYAYGQVPQSYDYEQTISLGVGKHVLSAPGEMAYNKIKLNDLNWDGDIVGLKNVTIIENPALEQAFGTSKIIRLDGISNDADMIVTYDPYGVANSIKSRIEFVNCDGKWYRKHPEYSNIAYGDEAEAEIPAGQAFWFVKQKSGTVTFSWTPAAPAPVTDGASAGDVGSGS